METGQENILRFQQNQAGFATLRLFNPNSKNTRIKRYIKMKTEDGREITNGTKEETGLKYVSYIGQPFEFVIQHTPDAYLY